MTVFNGSPDDDIFTGGSDNDAAYGNDGNDTLNGNDGSDLLYGGAGADTLNGGNNDDILISFDATNVVYSYSSIVSLDVGTEHDVLSGGDGDDILVAGYGDDVSGGSGYNKLYINFLGATSGVYADFRLQQSGGSITVGGATISGVTQTVNIQGSNYDDTIYSIGSYYGYSILHGNGGNDLIVGDYYNREIYGDDGNDTLDGRGSQYLDRLEGGAGDDTLYTNANTFATANGGDGNDTIYSHATTYGGAGNDLIILQNTYYKGYVYGEAGDDEIRACDTGDIISGGDGGDVLRGNAGDDNLASANFVPGGPTAADDMGLEFDHLTGEGGSDTLAIGYGDDADGGSGNDTLRLSLGGLASGITFSTAGIVTGQPFSLGGGTIQNIETLACLRGTNFGDTLTLATQAQLLTVDAGDGDDVITSNSSSVSVLGGNGNDRFISGAAGDIFDGGVGADTADYRNYVNAVTVKLGLAAGSTGTGPGGDQVINVENVDGSNLADTIWGSDDANTLQGLNGDDTLKGFGGNDTLIGGAGLDNMTGGLGNDYFFVDNAGDVVIEAAGEGSDRIFAGVSYALAAGQQVEMITTDFNGGTSAINFTGNALSQGIYGNEGANILDGGGGGDTLVGFGGDDYYYIRSATDRVVESAGGGNDRVFAAVSFKLEAGSQVEMITTDFNAGTSAINLTGNALSQGIYGNEGANILDSGGGGDTMVGFGGDDFYYVRSIADRALESAGGGNDRVFAAVSFTLEAGSQVEMLTTDFNGGTGAINLTGNALSQGIYGNAGANILDGGGGGDTLVGFGGDDFYYVRSATDRALESAGGGNDRVLAAVSFTLEAGSEIEMLTTDFNGGTNAINLTGNALSQGIYGNEGANILDGGGGGDTLIGFGGDDLYYVHNSADRVVESAGGGNDRIFASVSFTLEAGSQVEMITTDFNPGTSAIDLTGNELANSIYGNAGANVLDGKGGNDGLVGFGGADTFAFTTALGAGNVDTIIDFTSGTDKIALDDAVFTGIGGLGALNASAFVAGTAAGDADDRIIYDAATGNLYFDADGNGAGAAVLFANLSSHPVISASDFQVI